MLEWKKWDDKVIPMSKGLFIVASGQNEDVDLCKLWFHDGDWKWVNQNNVVRYALQDDHYAEVVLPAV